MPPLGGALETKESLFSKEMHYAFRTILIPSYACAQSTVWRVSYST